MISSNQDKNIDKLELGCLYHTWPTFVYTNLSIQRPIRSRRHIKACWRKFEKMLLVVLLLFLHAKQLLMKILFVCQQTYANHSWGLILANYTAARCVNRRPPVFIRVGISIQRKVVSHLDKTTPEALTLGLFLTLNEQGQIAITRASLQQTQRKKLTASVLMVFVHIAALCSKQGAASTTFVSFKRFNHLSLKRIFILVVKRQSSINWADTVYEKKASLSLYCGSVNGGDCTRQATLFKKRIREIFIYRRSLAAEQLLNEIKNAKFLAKFNAILQFPKIWQPIILFSQVSSRTL